MRNKYIHNLNKRVGRTLGKQKMLAEGDKILVALSGGKDSMILLDILTEARRHLPFPIEIFACHIYIDNIGYITDIDYLDNFCASLNVKFFVKQFQIEMSDKSKKSECFICSWNRRKALFELTKELGCNKMAFGHHMDDALQTMFLNLMYHGSISSMPFKLKMFDGRVEVIRPLLEITEKELVKYSQIKGYKKEVKRCGFENTKRSELKGIINSLEQMHPIAKKNMFRAMDNIYEEYLPHWEK